LPARAAGKAAALVAVLVTACFVVPRLGAADFLAAAFETGGRAPFRPGPFPGFVLAGTRSFVFGRARRGVFALLINRASQARRGGKVQRYKIRRGNDFASVVS
jgi:hypothetical protein